MNHIVLILITLAAVIGACKKNKCICTKYNYCTTIKYTRTATSLTTQAQQQTEHTGGQFCEVNYGDHLAYITAISYQEVVIQNNYPCLSPDSSCNFTFHNEEVLSQKLVKEIPIGLNKKDKINFYTKEGYNCNCK